MSCAVPRFKSVSVAMAGGGSGGDEEDTVAPERACFIKPEEPEELRPEVEAKAYIMFSQYE